MQGKYSWVRGSLHHSVVQQVFVNSMSSLVGALLGCTALMRAYSPKHPSGCLQFAKMEGKRRRWKQKELGSRRRQEGRKSTFIQQLLLGEVWCVVCVRACVCVCVCVRVCVCACVLLSLLLHYYYIHHGVQSEECYMNTDIIN